MEKIVLETAAPLQEDVQTGTPLDVIDPKEDESGVGLESAR